ncbi:SEC-C metal-binding domain-containing protein [Streptomyces sp. M92]|uniref:SEC-C metal-binding domain-containing protein n=1 Tax=Streptomyces sp. M92 TaxID=2944250 RepID=UPI00234BE281|nr:SEC-C metal-binding domain-containing protein [Streptomyces sp. M92]WCN05137.1 SEC-C metal-binding domain-containing protein [Streptomyces sp. M92]
MKHLSVDRRGYPVIATVDRSPQEVNFGSINERRKLALATFDWCAVCGMPFADELRWQMVFQEGPLPTAIAGEAPVHEVCALYAAQVCPYLFSPQSRLGDEFRKGSVRDAVVRFVGFESTRAVIAHESGLQPGVYTLHFEHQGQADEFSYHSPDELRDRFAKTLASEQDLPVSDAEGVLIRLFNRLDDEGEGDVVTGAALIAGAAFAKDIFKVQGMKAFASKEYPTVAGLLLKGSDQEILEFCRSAQDEAFGAVGPWVVERAGALPLPLQRWRKRGASMVRRSAPQRPTGPGRSVAKNAACPCGSGRKARRCHPAGFPVS